MESTKTQVPAGAKALDGFQRRARTEESAEAWQRYARALERWVELPRELPRYALVNEGDVYINNRFWSDEALPYRKGDDRQSLLDAMLAREVARCGQRNETLVANFARRVGEVRGAWVFDQAVMALMQAVWEADNLSRDSHYEGRDLALRTIIQAWSLNALGFDELAYLPSEPLPEPRKKPRMSAGEELDAVLYNLRRMALLRGSRERWRRYARALERRKNGRDQDKGRFAVFYALGGDASHSIRGQVPYNNEPIPTLLDKLYQSAYSSEDPASYQKHIVGGLAGAWIIDEDALELLFTLDDANPGWDCGYDAWSEARAGVCLKRRLGELRLRA